MVASGQEVWREREMERGREREEEGREREREGERERGEEGREERERERDGLVDDRVSCNGWMIREVFESTHHSNTSPA